jgi:hypothetical protein
MGDPFKHMDMAGANASCGSMATRESIVFEDCQACKRRVGLHCTTCKIQVTGCICSDRARFDPITAWQSACNAFGEAAARKAYREAGFAIPGEDLVLPSSN